MTMRDEYRTKAAEFQTRAAGESDRMTRLHFESLANDYERLAELADRNAQLDLIYRRRSRDLNRKR
jgi:hypothetical protein